MKCPYCFSTKTRVIDKRFADETSNRRRRECSRCGKRFTTFERVEEELVVIKKDKRRQKFDRNKLKSGILKACEKRPIGYKTIEKMVDDVESHLRSLGKQEIKSKVIGEIVMEKLQDLDEVAYVRFASYYKHFTDIKSFEEELRKLRVVREIGTSDATDISLLVTAPRKGMTTAWDREKVVKTLMKEVRLSKVEAQDIALSVEKKIFASGIKTITVNLIRELVDNELFVKGYNKKLEKRGMMIGMPIYNLKKVIFSKSKENSNIISNNPEAVNLAIAENTLKQFALKNIFSKKVTDAHLKGAMHIHDLGYPVRVYCSSHSLEFIKKYGLRLLNLATTSKPAKYAGTLTGHLNTFLASMQANYAGALGIAFLNVFYAPFLVGTSYKELKQQAQYLIFSSSQNAFSRGGQTLFIDFNVHLGVPSYMKEVPAIGPGGKYMLKKNGKIESLDEVPRDKRGRLIQPNKGRILTYGDFEKEAQAFAKAMLDVWREGDGDGKPFPFPKCDLHVNQEAFEDPKQLKLLKYACQIASENGSPYFVFDRGDGATLSQCCRLKTKITDERMINHPESMRFCGFQNVTINLPQAAYRGKGDVERTIKEIHKTMDLAMKAHLQKKRFIERIMNSEGMPLWQLGMMLPDGKPYLNLEEATYIIGLIGLNECVKYLMGGELHESEKAYKLGLKIISAMYLKTNELEKENKLKVLLEETPGESASLRLARVDLNEYPESEKIVRGDKSTGEVYYTNSIHFVPDAPIDITERIEKQGKFNPLIESGSITHVFLGEQKPDPKAVFNLVKKTWENTESAQITISPEFTVCKDCGRISRGYMRENVVPFQLAADGGNIVEMDGGDVDG